MDLYQHDSAAAFRFVLRGELAGDAVRQLQQAWETAKSIIGGKALIVDLSRVTTADEDGANLLSRMGEAGARLVGPPSRRPRRTGWAGRMFSFCRHRSAVR